MLKLSFEDQFLIIISQIQSKDPKSGFNKNPRKYLIKQLFEQGSFISEVEWAPFCGLFLNTTTLLQS